VDWVVLVERDLEFFEEEDLLSFRNHLRELGIVDHPSLGSLLGRALRRVAESLRLPVTARPERQLPRQLLRLIESRYRQREYQTVIVSGLQLAGVLEMFPRWTQKILDLPRSDTEAWSDCARQGRADGLPAPVDPDELGRLLECAESLVVTSAEDAVSLRTEGHQIDCILVPPAGWLGGPPRYGDPRCREPEQHPPRILVVGSETTANLDGFRWFRHEVLPRIQQTIPTCRLRIAGELGRYLEPAPGVDRIGRVDDLDEEYARATLVALPLRMGSGVHRRAVEALVRGKALCTTSVGARGTGLTPQIDAIVADDPAVLAEESARVLGSEEVRCEYEARALRLGQDRFDAETSMAALADVLGLPRLPAEVLYTNGGRERREVVRV
jgi:hypothetical protein